MVTLGCRSGTFHIAMNMFTAKTNQGKVKRRPERVGRGEAAWEDGKRKVLSRFLL